MKETRTTECIANFTVLLATTVHLIAFNILAGLTGVVPVGAVEDLDGRHHLFKANLYKK